MRHLMNITSGSPDSHHFIPEIKMNRKIAIFLFAVALAATASAAHMDDFACREYCALERQTCETEGAGGCLLVERQCLMECRHV